MSGLEEAHAVFVRAGLEHSRAVDAFDAARAALNAATEKVFAAEQAWKDAQHEHALVLARVEAESAGTAE